MLLHVLVPAFHAAVHQAALPHLRGQPVAVAVDAGEDAPCLCASVEAQAFGVHPGMRASEARRRCPGLRVVTPEHEWYARAQAALVEHCAVLSPQIGGGAGCLDVDVRGVDRSWSAAHDAKGRFDDLGRRLRAHVGEHLGLDLRLGFASQLRRAHYAAHAARTNRSGVSVLDADQITALDDCPLTAIDGITSAALRRLGESGITSLHQAVHHGAVALRQLLGAHAKPLTALILGTDDLGIGALRDSNPGVTTVAHLADDGDALDATLGCVRDLADRLDDRNLGCTTLTLYGLHHDGRQVQRTQRSERQLRHVDDLEPIAVELMHRSSRRSPWRSLHLVASGLCCAEMQLSLFASERRRDETQDADWPLAESLLAQAG